MHFPAGVRLGTFWLIAAWLPACGFTAPEPGTDVEDPYPGGGPAPGTMPPPASARRCSITDTSLRLCLDFEDAKTGDDGSTFQHDAVCTAVNVMTREQEKAGQLSAQSRMIVAETPDLDITANLSVSLWAHPNALPMKGQPYWALDNNKQYFVEYLDNGKFRCGIGTTTVDAKLGVTPDSWYHVGCTYDQAHQSLRVYVNGHLAGCKTTTAAIPTDGAEGLAIGGNVASGPGGPSFSQPFIGGLDNIEVFARTLTEHEMCDAASNSGCWDNCPYF